MKGTSKANMKVLTKKEWRAVRHLAQAVPRRFLNPNESPSKSGYKQYLDQRA